jgi:hypothetical protein
LRASPRAITQPRHTKVKLNKAWPSQLPHAMWELAATGGAITVTPCGCGPNRMRLISKGSPSGGFSQIIRATINARSPPIRTLHGTLMRQHPPTPNTKSEKSNLPRHEKLAGAMSHRANRETLRLTPSLYHAAWSSRTGTASSISASSAANSPSLSSHRPPADSPRSHHTALHSARRSRQSSAFERLHGFSNRL